VFNTWPGLDAERLPALTEEDERDPVLQGDVDTVLAHIKEVICNSDNTTYAWLRGFVACMLKAPGNKRQSPAVVLVGEKGDGKDIFVELIKNLVGLNLTFTSNNWLPVLGQFNA
jgi:phage/plasmid-associated DNA primase